MGRATVKHLAESGYEVINLDRVRPKGASEDGKSGTPAYRIVEIDLENYGEVIDALNEIDMGYKGVEAVVHLAAIPSPGQVAASKQFRVNTMRYFSFVNTYVCLQSKLCPISTYNILEACRKLGITNIVLASSETLIGIPFDPHPPNALPITEDEPRKPESSYSLSKLVGEVIAEEHCRWNPNTLKIVSLRFSNVMLEEEYASFEDWQNDPSLRYWNAWGYIDVGLFFDLTQTKNSLYKAWETGTRRRTSYQKST